MPPTDKALAVMTPAKADTLVTARVNTHFRMSHHDGIASVMYCDHRDCANLRNIESVVRYLVDHPERLAGEDEVVVKRAEAIQVLQKLRGAIDGDALGGTDGQRIVMDWLAIERSVAVKRDLLLAWADVIRQSASEDRPSLARDVARSIDHQLAGSPTAQESK